jgi:predicted metalloprotease with PDZ domain
MLKSFLVGLLLQGYISNTHGYCGVRIDNCTGKINHVWSVSPAQNAGLLVGDQIVEADYHKGASHTDGIADTEVFLKVKRGGDILEFKMIRVDKSRLIW